MEKVLYDDRALDPLIGTKIYQKNDKVIFEHLGESDDSGHPPFGFHIEIDANMYQKGTYDLLKTGKCFMEEPNGIEGCFGQMLEIERIGVDLHITCEGGILILSDFDFNELVLLTKCPNCGQDKGKLVRTGTEIRVHEGIDGGFQDLMGYYECQNCGQKWDLVLEIGPPL